MKEIVEKLKLQEELMAKEKGPFVLFALFLREDAPDKWDLLVSGEWIEKDKHGAIKYIANILQKKLSKEELLKLSRIVIIDKNNPALEAFNRAIKVEHISAEVQNSNFFGLRIKHAYIITSNKHNG